MLEEKRFRHDCACAARAEELGAGHQKVDEEDEELAHLPNTTIYIRPCKTPRRGRIPSHYEFAPNRAKRVKASRVQEKPYGHTLITAILLLMFLGFTASPGTENA